MSRQSLWAVLDHWLLPQYRLLAVIWAFQFVFGSARLLSIFEGIGLEGLGLEALGFEWWAIAALLFLLPKVFALLLALLFLFAEKIPGFDSFAGGRIKAFKDRLNQQLMHNFQRVIQLFRPFKP